LSFGVVQLDIANNAQARSAYNSILGLLHSENQISDEQYAGLSAYSGTSRPDLNPVLRQTYAEDIKTLTTQFNGPFSSQIRSIIANAQSKYLSTSLVPKLNSFINNINDINPSSNILNESGNDANLARAALVSLYNRNPGLFNNAANNLINQVADGAPLTLDAIQAQYNLQLGNNAQWSLIQQGAQSLSESLGEGSIPLPPARPADLGSDSLPSNEIPFSPLMPVSTTVSPYGQLVPEASNGPNGTLTGSTLLPNIPLDSLGAPPASSIDPGVTVPINPGVNIYGVNGGGFQDILNGATANNIAIRAFDNATNNFGNPADVSNPVFTTQAPQSIASGLNPVDSFSDAPPPDFSEDESPIVLDLSGKGINITPLTSSNMFVDLAGNGFENRTAWAGAGNAVLFFDPNNTNEITNPDQVIFTDWDPTATTDLQALEDVFDTNHDGSLDAGDADFSEFKLMVTNANGTTSVETLAQAGISSINLTANYVTQTFTDGSSIDGETTFTTISGTTGTAAGRCRRTGLRPRFPHRPMSFRRRSGGSPSSSARLAGGLTLRARRPSRMISLSVAYSPDATFALTIAAMS
jgi:hypothetical protein